MREYSNHQTPKLNERVDTEPIDMRAYSKPGRRLKKSTSQKKSQQIENPADVYNNSTAPQQI